MYQNINIIFHHPLPLNENAKSASGIRPVRMLNAFRKLGCSVDLVTGYAVERKECIKDIKINIRKGKRYDFVYSESSTMPTILTEEHHLPTHPMCDWFFFRFCKKNNIPIGLFYRDIYWLFEDYGKNLNPMKAVAAKLAYKFDLWVYQKMLTKLYLPSIEMGAYIPSVSPSIFSALPPGHMADEIKNEVIPDLSERKLKLFYVGGMSKHYQMHKLFEAVREMPIIELIICTRKDEWLAVKNQYPGLTPNIQILHLSGKDMEDKLASADIALLFIEPYEYWDFASPVKLYEYLGFQKPVIVSKDTLAGKFVENNGIGWTIPYDAQEMKKLLIGLSTDITAHVAVRNKLQQISPQHSWRSRALQVIEDLVK
ncbi:glycosyltransferase [Citrobacter braakii]